LDNLRKNGKTKEANEFRSELDKMLQRDCIVKVTWTGDADIDATVEDPSGSVCSAANPRSPGGGVLLGDVYSRANLHSKDGFSETYIVPQGFSGQYKLLLRRVWGQVATGKVTVDVITHSGTPRMRHLRKQIPVGERDAVVSFDLDDGRRTERLDQVQLANATKQQLDVSRAVLAQQLAAIETPSPGSNGGTTNPPGPIAGGPQGNRFLPFGARGGVGYQPVIQTLPEGTNMSATAVISADRRYVRISATPFFSTIGPVNTFNFATGQEGTDPNNLNNPNN
jgi:hypothetical protein